MPALLRKPEEMTSAGGALFFVDTGPRYPCLRLATGTDGIVRVSEWIEDAYELLVDRRATDPAARGSRSHTGPVRLSPSIMSGLAAASSSARTRAWPKRRPRLAVGSRRQSLSHAARACAYPGAPRIRHPARKVLKGAR